MKYRILTLALLVSVLTGYTQAQDTLADHIEAAGTGWMLGEWVGETAEGSSHRTSFKWDLNKKVIVSESKNPRWSTKTLTALDPKSTDVTLVGYSSLGSKLEGKWDAVQGKLILKLKISTRNRDDSELAIRYSRAEDNKMKIELLELDENEVIEPARWSMELKRAK